MMTMYYSCLIFAILLSFPSAYGVKLDRNYYKDECPNVEGDIKKVVHTEANRGICAGVIRLFFHDCFVNGCDGSVLLDFPDLSEKYSPDNVGLRGFELIEDAKIAADKSCKNTSAPQVSCADVLAYAARDCVELVGDFTYNVVAGRRDSTVSRKEDTKDNLPGAFFNFAQLKKNFAAKGFLVPELVALTGAHSIGVANCSSFEKRFNEVVPDEINPTYAAQLKTKCASQPIVDQDHVTPNKLDVQWFKNEIKNEVLFLSDWELRTDPTSESIMETYAGFIPSVPVPVDVDLSTWKIDFGKAMEKMGNILGGDGGEIRKVCSKVNYN